VDEEGAPRVERIVPVALVAVGVVGLFVFGSGGVTVVRAETVGDPPAYGCLQDR